jgi:DNA-binding CsgD family transcriptional regulator
MNVQLAPAATGSEWTIVSEPAPSIESGHSSAGLVADNLTQTLADALVAILNQFRTPLILLRRDKEVVHLNTTARELLRVEGALRIAGSRLVTRRAEEEACFSALVAAADAHARPAIMALRSRSGDPVMLLAVTPVSTGALVMLRIASLREQATNERDWIQQAFGLSSQGAELAEALMEGLSLAEFCDKRGVTLGAARTRLKKLFGRTGSRSQASLAALLLRAAAIAPALPRSVK